MPKTILRLVWPYVLRYLAKHAATYLENRREQKRLLKLAEASALPDSPDVTSEDLQPPQPAPSPTRPIWYVLAGVLLGSAVGLMLAKLLREEN